MVSSTLFKDKETAGKDLIDEMNKGDKYFIAIEDGEVIGFVSGGPRNIHDRRGEYELFHIGTTKKGIAKNLFNTLIEEAKKHYHHSNSHLRKFYLFTSQSNENAHSFYEHIGMNITGCSIDKFGSGKSEIEYSLMFNQHGKKTESSLTINKDELFNMLSKK